MVPQILGKCNKKMAQTIEKYGKTRKRSDVN
jgi:hypothetical protein